MIAPQASTVPSGASPAAFLSSADRAALEAAALEAGFEKCGVAAVPAPGSAEDTRQQARFAEWVAMGRAGEMAWLTRTDESGELVRSSLHRSVPWARSVILCAKVYNALAPFSTEPAPDGTGWIARYAWSGAAASRIRHGRAPGAAARRLPRRHAAGLANCRGSIARPMW